MVLLVVGGIAGILNLLTLHLALHLSYDYHILYLHTFMHCICIAYMLYFQLEVKL